MCHFRRGHIGNWQRSDNTVRRGNRRYRRAFGCIFQENRHIYRYICHDSNTILYTVCGITIKSWILPLYSIVTYYIGSKTVDFVVEGIDKTKCAMIVTTKANNISDILAEQFEASGTIVKAIGGYSKEQKEIIYFIVNHFQINKLKKIVHDIDPSAFISLQDVSDIIQKNHET